jgi:glycosyltransferase involved in cell wall biosynthesis
VTGHEELRILYVLPDFGVGGGQVILLRTLVAATAIEGEHLVVGLRGGPMRARFEEAGIATVVLDRTSWRDAPGALRRLVRLIRTRRPHAVVSFNTPEDRTFAQVAGVLTRTPVVVWFMSVAIALIPFPPPIRRLPAFAKRLALIGPNYSSIRLARSLMSLSDAVALSFAEHLRLDRSRFHLVPPGLPASFFEPACRVDELAALREELGLDDATGPVLLNVGMLIDLKGQHELVPAMVAVVRALPGATLLLVGDGENRERLSGLIEEHHLGGRVRLLGHRHDVPALLQLADGLVSASRSEGFGMAVLEAMAAGKPVVAVHTPAYDEFAPAGRSAYFVQRQDRGLLAAAIVEVFSDPRRTQAMGVAARADAERFRVEHTAKRLLDVLRDAVRT